MNHSKTGDRILSAPLSEPDEGGPGSRWRPTRNQWPKDVRDLKKFMGWMFACLSLLYLTLFVRTIPYAIQWQLAAPFPRNLLAPPTFWGVVACIAGVAWWTIWKGKSSARGWAIAASLMNILIFLRQFIVPFRPVPGRHVGVLFFGVVGLVTFLRRDKRVGA